MHDERTRLLRLVLPGLSPSLFSWILFGLRLKSEHLLTGRDAGHVCTEVGGLGVFGPGQERAGGNR